MAREAGANSQSMKNNSAVENDKLNEQNNNNNNDNIGWTKNSCFIILLDLAFNQNHFIQEKNVVVATSDITRQASVDERKLKPGHKAEPL